MKQDPSTRLEREILNKLNERVAQTMASFVPVIITAIVGVGIIASVYPTLAMERLIANLAIALSALPAIYLTWRGQAVRAIRVSVVLLSVVLSAATIFNSGVMAPAYVALLTSVVYLSPISTPRLINLYYLGVVLLGALSLSLEHLALITPKAPPSKIYYWAIYSMQGFFLTRTLLLTDRALKEEIAERVDRERLLASTLSSIEEALVVLNAQHEVAQRNASAERLEAELLATHGVGLLEVVVETEQGQSLSVRDALSLASPARLAPPPTVVRLSEGVSQRWLSLALAPRSAPDEPYRGAVLLIRDITHQRQLEQVSRLNAIGKLAGGVAHDFNNMLGAISGAVELLSLELDEEQAELLTLISSATDRAAKLTQQLMMYSRSSAQLSAKIDVHATARATARLLERLIDARVEVRLELRAPRAVIKGDESALQSALMNLCMNAAQAMPEGGVVVIRSCVRQPVAEARLIGSGAVCEAECLCVEVEDSGVGIPPEVEPHIFEPFFSTKGLGKGTGLGLAAVYGMVKRHNGAIEVSTQVGRGTSFFLYLPLAPEDALPAQASPEAQEVVSGHGRLLVVDDEPLVRATLCGMLKSLGYEVEEREDGAQGVRAFEEAEAAGRPFDMVMLDMVMPVMDGRAAYHAIKSLRPDVPIVISSGFAREEALQDLQESGLVTLLSKPYRRAQLSVAVHEALASRTAR